MKIGIDGRMYGPKQGGLGRYIEQLIKHLEKIDHSNEYVIFLRKENWDQYTPVNSKFKKVLADIPWYGFKEQIFLPKIIKKQKLDLMHFPHWNVPLLYNQKFVVTIHDLLLLHYPSRQASTLTPLLYWFKNKIFRLVLRHAAKKAKNIITISQFSRQDISKTLKIPIDGIVTIYLAPLKKIKNTTSIDLSKYGVTKPYWLYVGVAYPHKNLETLVTAWEIFSAKKDEATQLVLIGKKNYFYQELQKIIKEKNIKNVVLTDFVPDSELCEFYRQAKLYVFPSLYEGFGLPPLEAMQYDLPVISSDRTCLPEILGSAALYFDPTSNTEIAQTAQLVLTNKNIQAELIKNGQKLLKKYSWETTASETLSVYQKTSKKVDN